MKYEKFTKLQSAYIDAIGSYPVVWICKGSTYSVSMAKDFWRYSDHELQVYWFADEITAARVKKNCIELLSLLPNPMGMEFSASIITTCGLLDIYYVPHDNMILMADASIELVTNDYEMRKAKGEFRAYFKQKKKARSAARLVGNRASSAAQDEVDLKIALIRKAISDIS